MRSVNEEKAQGETRSVGDARDIDGEFCFVGSRSRRSERKDWLGLEAGDEH